MMGVPPGEAVFVVRGKTGPAIRADGSMVSDSDLLWRFQPGTVFNGRTVNELGFLDREVSVAKPHGVHRVVCMGDSCSGQGTPPYSGHLNALLQSQTNTTDSWEAFNTAVHGYTVLQGLALYRKHVADLEPDIVTIFYGWNDHWLSTTPDARLLARSGSALGTAARNALARKRIAVAMRTQRGADTDVRTGLRVPPEEYAEALATLVEEIQADGAIPVVLTAPRARTISRRIVHGGLTRSVEEAIELHDQYADITRHVARGTGARLFDLAALFTEPSHFSDDGIHYTDDGIRHLAQLLHGEIIDVIRTAPP
ncbi:MAG: GDSL-type esterase/lipase family protein [Verrucomicrobia bacterium]|nr:GDSL-type esterase/lipase family protein [Verrucomicrobiota bacterium]